MSKQRLSKQQIHQKQGEASPGSSRGNTSGNTNPRSTTAIQMEQAENSNVFKQLFATLEAEHLKLQGLEQRRLRLTEEMQSLREMLHQENRKLRSQSQEPPNRNDASSSAVPTKKKSTIKVKPTPRQAGGNRCAVLENDVTACLYESKGSPVGKLDTMKNPFKTQPTYPVGEVMIKLVDTSSELRQIHSISAPVVWHTPVRSMDLETYWAKMNQKKTETSAESREDQPEVVIAD